MRILINIFDPFLHKPGFWIVSLDKYLIHFVHFWHFACSYRINRVIFGFHQLNSQVLLSKAYILFVIRWLKSSLNWLNQSTLRIIQQQKKLTTNGVRWFAGIHLVEFLDIQFWHLFVDFNALSFLIGHYWPWKMTS